MDNSTSSIRDRSSRVTLEDIGFYLEIGNGNYLKAELILSNLNKAQIDELFIIMLLNETIYKIPYNDDYPILKQMGDRLRHLCVEHQIVK